MAEESDEVDVVVIGLGPGGEACATELAGAGLRVVGVDERLVGGECPYFGCIPSKMIIRAAHTLAEGRRVGELAGAATVESDWAPVATRIRDEATDDWDDTAAVEKLTDAGVEFVRGHGRLDGTGRVVVDTPDGGQRSFTTRRGVVLNTGTAPSAPPIDGLDGTPYWTNRDVLRITELPASLAVLGGGPIGVEFAQAFARFGVRVTVIEVGDRIVAVEEPESSELLEKVLAREGVQVFTGQPVDEVAYADGAFTLSVGDTEVTADKLLVAAGRRPNLPEIGLDTVGLDPEAHTVETDERMVAGDKLWAIGDITGKGAFTHMSMYQSEVAVAAILGKDGPVAEYHAVPHVTFTEPEIGGVGMTEQQARDAGLDVETTTYDVASSSRGWIHGPGNDGLLKLVADRNQGVLVGATSAGPTGGEVLSVLTLAVHARVPVSQLRTMIGAYPTIHRAVVDAVKQLDSAG